MINLKQFKLNQQLKFLVITALFMMILVQVFYYFKFNAITQERAMVYNSKILNQVEEKLISNLADVKQAAFTVSYSKAFQDFTAADNPEDKLVLGKYVSDSLSYTAKSNKNIAGIYMVNSDGKLLSNAVESNGLQIFDILNKYSNQIKSNNSVFSEILTDSQGGYHYYAYISPVVSLENNVKPGTVVSACITLCNIRNLQKSVANVSFTKNSLFVVLDKENNIILSNGKQKVGTKFDNIEVLKGSNYQVKEYKNKKSIIQYKTIPEAGWNILSVIPVNELSTDMQPVKNFGIIIGFLTMCLLLIISTIIIRSITKPISQLVAFMKSVCEESTKKRLQISYNNEIGMLANYTNKMLDDLESITRKIFTTQSALYEAELKKKQAELAQKYAELSALQSQINPHFLYNTLECISSYAVCNDIPEIDEISTSLAKMFRYSIKGDNYVLVSNEISCVKDYLRIMDIRFNKRFSTEINIDENLMNEKILKMILQPLIENAIYHGLETKRGPGKITINGFICEDSMVHFEICDDGTGIEESVLKALNESFNEDFENSNVEINSRSIGLLNIDRRIKLYYGSQYKLKIYSKVYEGTTVELKFPSKEL